MALFGTTIRCWSLSGASDGSTRRSEARKRLCSTVSDPIFTSQVRPNKPYKLMIRGRMDSVFPVIDRDVLWGTDVANYVQRSDVEMWIPFASDGSLDGGISDKVSMGKPDSMSHIFREIAKHVGEANWGTDEMAEVAMWRSIAQVGWKDLIGRFNWSVTTVR